MLSTQETASVQSGHGLMEHEAEWHSIVPGNARFRHATDGASADDVGSVAAGAM